MSATRDIEVLSYIPETNVFISYSHEDEKWLKLIKKYLKKDSIHSWDATQIPPGELWRKSIEQALENTRVAVFLVSTDFLNSEFITENELPPLLDRAKDDDVTILWIPIRPSRKNHPLAQFQALINPDTPLSSLSGATLEKYLVDISEKIEEAVANWESKYLNSRASRTKYIGPADPAELSKDQEQFKERRVREIASSLQSEEPAWVLVLSLSDLIEDQGIHNVASVLKATDAQVVQLAHQLGKIIQRYCQTGVLSPETEEIFRKKQSHFGKHSTLLLQIGNNNSVLTIRFNDGHTKILGRAGFRKDAEPDIDLLPYMSGDEGISKQHAMLEYREHGLFITDLDSRNKTYLNGEPLNANESVPLLTGSIIRLGSLQIYAQFEHAPGA